MSFWLFLKALRMFEKQSGKGHKISNSITEENGSTIKGLYKDFEIEFET